MPFLNRTLVDISSGYPAAQATLADTEVLRDSRDRLLPQAGQLHGTLTKLRGMGSGHVDILPEATNRLRLGVRQSGGSSRMIKCVGGVRPADVPAQEAGSHHLVERSAPADVRGARLGESEVRL